MSETTEDDKTRRARARVEAMTAFYIHLAIFAAVIVVLAIIDWALGPGWWVQWVLLGWGIGVVAHYLIVFGETPEYVRRWQERKIEEIKNKS